MSSRIPFRNRRFGLGPGNVRACADSDVIASAFYGGLSTTFPDGERFFVQSVKAHMQFVGPELAEEVTAFVRQEGAHAREHAALNDQFAAVGYDMVAILARAQRQLQIVGARSAIERLGTTIALEHFTAIFARRLLADPRHLGFADPKTRDLWRWHAVEEIEHKAVAYDVFLAATKGWTGWRRWSLRTRMMIDAMARLAGVVLGNIADILKAEGARNRSWLFRLTAFLFIGPGILRQMAPDIAAYFAPGFHPDHRDDAPLLAQNPTPADLQPAFG
jgi:hypothetical protein